jgi:hypothetical protein
MAIHLGGGQGGLEQFDSACGQYSRGATISQGTNVSKPASRINQQATAGTTGATQIAGDDTSQKNL